jgi:hypothetical protein
VISGFRRSADKSCAYRGIIQHQTVILYRRFGTMYRSHLQGPRSPKRVEVVEKSRDLRSPGVLHSSEWYSFTDVLGQRIGPIFKGQEVRSLKFQFCMEFLEAHVKAQPYFAKQAPEGYVCQSVSQSVSQFSCYFTP